MSHQATIPRWSCVLFPFLVARFGVFVCVRARPSRFCLALWAFFLFLLPIQRVVPSLFERRTPCVCMQEQDYGEAYAHSKRRERENIYIYMIDIRCTLTQLLADMKSSASSRSSVRIQPKHPVLHIVHAFIFPSVPNLQSGVGKEGVVLLGRLCLAVLSISFHSQVLGVLGFGIAAKSCRDLDGH